MILDFDDFCTWMFVIVDDLWQGIAPLYRRPGSEPSSCSDSELITVAIIAVAPPLALRHPSTPLRGTAQDSALDEAYGSMVNLAASRTPPPLQRGAVGCHAKRRSTAEVATVGCPRLTTAAARVDAAGRGAAASLCSAMRRVARCEGVDENAHIRAEDRG